MSSMRNRHKNLIANIIQPNLPPACFLASGRRTAIQKDFRCHVAESMGVIFNDGGGDTYFVDELRKAFRSGGFPFWQGVFERRKFYSPMEYRPNFEILLPQLKEGLLDL